jgi:hypothetical protein
MNDKTKFLVGLIVGTTLLMGPYLWLCAAAVWSPRNPHSEIPDGVVLPWILTPIICPIGIIWLIIWGVKFWRFRKQQAKLRQEAQS